MPRARSLLSIPKFKVPILDPDVSGDPYTPWLEYDWAHRLLTEPLQTPIVGSWGMFDLYNEGFGTYPRPGEIRNYNFGRPGTLTKRPRMFVFRFTGSGRFPISDKLINDLIAAGVDIHGCQIPGPDSRPGGPGDITLGWNATQPGILGTCIPVQERFEIDIPKSGEDSPLIINYNVAGILGSGFPGFPDPSVTNPGFFHYSHAVEGSSSYWVAHNVDQPFDYQPSGSTVISPSDTERAIAGISHPEQYVGGDMLVFDSITPHIDIFGSNAYTSVQQNAVLGTLNSHFTPIGHTGYGPLSQVVSWNLNCLTQTSMLDLDRAIVDAAVPRFDKVKWHIFSAEVESVNFNTDKEFHDTGLPRNAGREATQAEAAMANIRLACDHPNITLHEVGGIGDVPLELGEALIREFFNLPD